MAKKPEPESIAVARARLEAQLHREGLAAAEFDYPIARRQVFDENKHRHFHPAAAEFLDEHPWPDTEAGRFDRAAWDLHAAGVSNRSMVPMLRARGHVAYNKRVDKTIARLKKLMDGRATKKRGRGRPADERFGRGTRSTVRVVVRFNEAEAGALYYAEDKLRLAGKIPPVTRRRARVRGELRDVFDRALAVVIRKAVVHFARGL